MPSSHFQFITAAGSDAQVANINAQTCGAQATQSNKFTAADIAKLKWIEGSWRGMDGDKPFYERYKVARRSRMALEGRQTGTSKDLHYGAVETVKAPRLIIAFKR